MGSMADSRIPLLLEILDQAFDKRAWHGTTLKGALRGLDPETAAWKPKPDRHSVWELLLHAAYWKYIVRRHVADDDALQFERSPSNWPRLPTPSNKTALKNDIAYLTQEHRLLRDAVAGLTSKGLDRRCGKIRIPVSMLVHGVAAHDLYHTGQIQLLKRLRR